LGFEHLLLLLGIRCVDRVNPSRRPVYPQEERLEIVAALRVVDEVFYEESLARKGEYIASFGADVLVMGADWTGKFDEFSSICRVMYLPRTVGISTTELITAIKKYS